MAGLIGCFGLLWLCAAAPAAAQEIKLGAFMPITGITADVGTQIKAGIEVAVDRANANGAHVRVLWYDTEGKADVGLNAVTRALSVDKIDTAIGFLSSDIFIRVMDEFQKAHVPVIDCCATSLKIGDKVAQSSMKYVFQLSPTAANVADSVAAAVAQSVKPSKIAMLNENTDAGRDFSKIVQAWYAAKAPSVQVVADEFVEHGATDMTAQMAKFKRLGAQAILGEVYGSSASILYEQWFELKVPAVIAHMGATVAADSFIKDNAKLMEGSIVNVRWWPAKYSPVSQPMMDAYKQKTGQDPTNFSIQGHDAALVMLDAIKTAGGADPDKVSAALAAGSFETAWGSRKFTPLEAGHRMPIETTVVQIQNGKKVPIYPEKVAAETGGHWQKVPPYAWEAK
ncbi:MAG TPA: ABC transporter substrate-binding protein [Stellaceae bacterium]|nr:ABC transporter substrate-binding protein [Stellaceae bacterium]